jgi:hypothetical protein
MKKQEKMSQGLRYFFKRLEKKSVELSEEITRKSFLVKNVPFDEVEKFTRSLMTQNIFINTVGTNGKIESTILSKAIFSINKVVRLYYSTSLDESRQGYIRLRADVGQQLIIVEKLHGLRPTPEVIYASLDECHVIRFFTNWILKRIDWDKTKTKHLELYKLLKEVEQEEHEAMIAKELEELEDLRIQSTLDKHFGQDRKTSPTG